MTNQKTITVKLVKSTIGRLEAHKACVRGLGLKKIHQTVTVFDTPSYRGLINRVSYMLEIAA